MPRSFAKLQDRAPPRVRLLGAPGPRSRGLTPARPAATMPRPMPPSPAPARLEQPYPVLQSAIDPRADAFCENRTRNGAALERLAQALAAARAGGGEKYVTRHLQRGKLLPRERVELLLDRDSHFLELCPLAGHEIDGSRTGRRHHRRHRRGLRRRVPDHRQRVDGQGRRGQRVSACIKTRSPGRDRRAESAARRSASPSPPARICPTSTRSSCPAGEAFATSRGAREQRTPDDLPGVRQLHRGRRLRPGHERLRGHGQASRPRSTWPARRW